MRTICSINHLLFDTILTFTLISIPCSAKRSSLPGTNFKSWTVNDACSNALYESNNMMMANKDVKENCSVETQYWSNDKKINRLIVKIGLRIITENITLEFYRGNKTESEKYYQKIANLPLIPAQEYNSTITNIYEVTVDGLGSYTGFQFRFSKGSFSGAIDKFEVEYESCPEVSEELVIFSAEPAPDTNQKLIIDGKCANNANLFDDTPLQMVCEFNGNHTISGKCVCNPGYSKEGTECKVCVEGEYKPDKGNDACLKCGRNVKKGTAPRLACECIDNFFRERGKNNLTEADCYESPAKPSGLKVTDVKADQATISWEKPHSGSLELGAYLINCTNCPPDRVEFPVKTKNLSVTVYKLGAFAKYNLIIYNENNVTSLTGVINEESFTITTAYGVPGKVTDVTNTSDSDGNVMFKWRPPFALGSDNLMYVIEYGDKTERIKETYFLIKKDPFDKTYSIRIGTEAIISGKVFSGPDFTGEIKVPGGISPAIAFGIAGGIIVFVVAVLVTSFCVWRRRNPAYLQVIRMEDGTVKLPARFYSGGSLYVDPKTYLLVDDAVSEFAFEIDRSKLTFGEKIGSGEFADVHKGILLKGGNEKETVAIKALKPGASKSDRDDFLSEAAILGQFSNPNVIFLEGVVLKDEPNLIVLEYMEHGALDSFLKEHDMQFTIEQLLEMARGIASGMKYLSEMGFIHRDLAARNILVNEKKTCKIADFGMSLEIKIEDRIDAKGSKIPVRWTSPEAIQFKQFTTASDIWSYGIVLWEIMSYGERPYWEWSNYEVLEKLNSGYRLPPPMGCPRVVHDLMLSCWEKERTKRPLFSAIRDRIDDWLQIPELLDELGPVVKLDDALDYTIMQTINKWLEAIDMGRYANNFLEQGFAIPRQILLLTMDDLEALGIGSLEHRRRIFKAIANTKSQVESNLVRMNSKTGTFRSQKSSK